MKKRENFEIFVARFRVKININLRNYLCNRLKKIKTIQIKYYNATQIIISFNIENKVLFNFKNIKITKLFKKINREYYNSCEIE